MQGQQQAAAREDASLAFKRYILDRSRGFVSEPHADLYRINLLAQMLDRYDELCDAGMSAQECLRQVRREFADIPERMADAGFERTDGSARRADSRWPQLSEADVEQYLSQESVYAHKNALGSAICSACCAPILVGAAFGEVFWRFSDAPAMLGVIGMFAMIGLGVYTFVTAEKPKLHNDVKRRRFSLSGRMRRRIEEMFDTVSVKARKRKAKGIAMFVTCIIPIFAGAMFGELFGGGSDFFPIMGVAAMFGMIGLGVYETVVGAREKEAVKRLLKQK